MPNLDQMFPRRFLRGADLKATAHVVTIADVQRLEVFNPGRRVLEKRWCLILEETEKMVVLNKTRAQQIAQVTGTEESTEWVGQQITLFPVDMTISRQPVIAINVRDVPIPEPDRNPDDIKLFDLAEPSDTDEPQAPETLDFDPDTGEIFDDTETVATDHPADARQAFYAIASEQLAAANMGTAEVNQWVKLANTEGWPAALKAIQAAAK